MLLVADHVALAVVIVTAIATSVQGLAQGLLSSVVYGLPGAELAGSTWAVAASAPAVNAAALS